MADLEIRIAKMEGKLIAHAAVLSMLAGKAMGHDAEQLKVARIIVQDAIERLYGRMQVTDLGHVLLQMALEECDNVLGPSGGVAPQADR